MRNDMSHLELYFAIVLPLHVVEEVYHCNKIPTPSTDDWHLVCNWNEEDFYKKLHTHFSNKQNTVLGKEIQEFKVALKDVFTNDRHWGWYLEDKRTWEFDEGSIVKIWKKVDLFYQEIKEFVLESNFISEENVLDTVIYFQKNAIVNPDKKYPYKLKLSYNIHDVINKGTPLTNGGYELLVDSNAGKNYKGDYIKWCRDLFWWG